MDEMTTHELEKKCESYRSFLYSLTMKIVSFERSTNVVNDLSRIIYDIQQGYEFMKGMLDADVVDRDDYEDFLSWFSFPAPILDEENFMESLVEIKNDLNCRFEGYRGLGVIRANERMKKSANFERWLEASCLNPGSVPLGFTPATAYLPPSPLITFE